MRDEKEKQYGFPYRVAESWVKAQLIVHTLKNSPGGWKLSMETIVILGVCFEDAILPGEAQGDPAMLEQILEDYKRRKKQ